MGKLLVLVLLVVAAVWLARRALRADAKHDAPEKEPFRGELVSCARCGLNLPRDEARASGGALFCSDEHTRMGPRAGA
jgi:uncharacterized protein